MNAPKTLTTIAGTTLYTLLMWMVISFWELWRETGSLPLFIILTIAVHCFVSLGATGWIVTHWKHDPIEYSSIFCQFMVTVAGTLLYVSSICGLVIIGCDPPVFIILTILGSFFICVLVCYYLAENWG
ncbi:MAG: hypothetical protein WC375_09845 [Methanomassiliicoccales archaeon]|jgi:hypothetical protein